MKYAYNLSILMILLTVMISCRKEEDLDLSEVPQLGGDTWVKGPIDTWIYDSLTKPYNIQVLYRWQPEEINIGAALVPPIESNVIAAMSAMKQIWIEPYNAETGSDLLIKKYAPKSLILVGSAEFLPNGSILLGQAEGGNKIAMYVINEFKKGNIAAVREMLHTIEHEFAHILHQNVLYPIEFKSITPQYTSSWFNFTNAEGNAEGFASAYAKSGPDDDFVETVSLMLVEGKARWEEMVTGQNAAAQTALRRKEAIVVDYFKKVWKIDFYSLQTRTQNALNNIAPDGIPVYYGFGKPYTVVSVNPASTTLTQGSAFLTMFNTAKTNLAAVPSGPRVLDSIAVVMNSATTIQVRSYYKLAANTTASIATFTYNMTVDANGVYTFTYVSSDVNATVTTALAPIANYFSNNTFKLTWVVNPNNTAKQLKVVFTPQQTANGAFMGILLP